MQCLLTHLTIGVIVASIIFYALAKAADDDPVKEHEEFIK
jgi:hypothetical protein